MHALSLSLSLCLSFSLYISLMPSLFFLSLYLSLYVLSADDWGDFRRIVACNMHRKWMSGALS